MKKYVLAVDGGATKTHILLMDMETTQMWREKGGPTNHEVLPGGYEQLGEVLKTLIGRILAQAGADVSQIAYGCFGMAGADLPGQHKSISDVISSLGISEFLLLNDAYLPILAGTEKGVGVGLINGSGFSAAAIDVFGQKMQIGGFYEYSDDLGGGGWYAKQTVAAAYSSIYKRTQQTSLRTRILSMLNIGYDAGMMEGILSEMQRDPKGTEKELCILLHKAADAGDDAAVTILQDSALEYAYCVRNLCDRLNFVGKVPVVLAGAQFVRGSNYLREMLISVLPRQCEARVLQEPPVVGALYEALRRQNFQLTPEFRAYAKNQAEQI